MSLIFSKTDNSFIIFRIFRNNLIFISILVNILTSFLIFFEFTPIRTKITIRNTTFIAKSRIYNSFVPTTCLYIACLMLSPWLLDNLPRRDLTTSSALLLYCSRVVRRSIVQITILNSWGVNQTISHSVGVSRLYK